DEVEAEDRRDDADGAHPQAANVVVEADEDEEAGEATPKRGGLEVQIAGSPGIKEDRRAEAPGLHHQEIFGLQTGGGGALVDEIADAVTDQRRQGIGDAAAHPPVPRASTLGLVRIRGRAPSPPRRDRRAAELGPSSPRA